MAKKSIRRLACMLGISDSSNTAGGASLGGIFLEESPVAESGGGVGADAKSSKSLMSTGTEEFEISCAATGGQHTARANAAAKRTKRTNRD